MLEMYPPNISSYSIVNEQIKNPSAKNFLDMYTQEYTSTEEKRNLIQNNIKECM